MGLALANALISDAEWKTDICPFARRLENHFISAEQRQDVITILSPTDLAAAQVSTLAEFLCEIVKTSTPEQMSHRSNLQTNWRPSCGTNLAANIVTSTRRRIGIHAPSTILPAN